MKERLVIKNFGPIKEADLTFGRFNVLIGEQATGKSTVAKLLAVCRYFSYLTGIAVAERDPFTDGLWDWGLNNFRKDDSYIEYTCNDYQLIYKNVPKITFDRGNSVAGAGLYDFEITKESERFNKLLSELAELQAEGKVIPYTFFKTSVAQVMQNPLFLGTERDSNFLDFPTSSLKGPIENSEKLRQIKSRFHKEVSIEPLSISYRSEGNVPFIKKHGETIFHELSNSASGYQSAVPIVLAIKSYTNPPEKDERLQTKRTKPKTFIIEEPELNLFPTAQNELMKFLVDKTMNYGNTMLIATHSPYILAALNNMMSAYRAGNKDVEATEKVLPKQYWLNHEDCSAYRMMPDGTCKDIFNREEGLIHSEEIDEISGLLNNQFDKTLNIQFWQK
jgi:energy-coupling factor transporter ATP-binding protein EcfA2